MNGHSSIRIQTSGPHSSNAPYGSAKAVQRGHGVQGKEREKAERIPVQRYSGAAGRIDEEPVSHGRSLPRVHSRLR